MPGFDPIKLAPNGMDCKNLKIHSKFTDTRIFQRFLKTFKIKLKGTQFESFFGVVL